MKVGLRIDVDTFRGTRMGVPGLCRLLEAHAVRSSFFFSVGPDNMGRHLWRLLRPAFFLKMIRSGAPSLYGWDILLKGTFWPGPLIGERLGAVIRSAAEAGHEAGLHVWDHHAWQQRIDGMSADAITDSLTKGVNALTAILGRPPACSAAPAWQCTNAVLEAKNRFPFVYNSDCRGYSLFRPMVKGRLMTQPQVPVTLPTYDEVIGREGVTDRNYNEYLLSHLNPEGLNVLTIHAEVEGIACLDMFADFIRMARNRGIEFTQLGELVRAAGVIEPGVIFQGELPGREGWLAVQHPLSNAQNPKPETKRCIP